MLVNVAYDFGVPPFVTLRAVFTLTGTMKVASESGADTVQKTSSIEAPLDGAFFIRVV
jgi:hypothetical protein